MNNSPIRGQYYRHVDGGVYFVLITGKSTEDQSQHVVYTHIYPFDMETWIRPLEQWTPARFTLIDHVEVGRLLALDRQQLKDQITEHKARRRASEGR
jgi:hypothetical protein